MSNPLPRTSTAYAFDPTTGEYTGPVTVYLSELEGRYPLPPNTVATAPTPPAGLYERHRLSSLSGMWNWWPIIAGDALQHRQRRADRQYACLGRCTAAGCTTSQPMAFLPSDYRRNVWDATRRSWRADPDYSAALVWEKATGAIAPRLAAGVALPGQLTTVAPPVSIDGTVVWDEDAQAWSVQPKVPEVAAV